MVIDRNVSQGMLVEEEGGVTLTQLCRMHGVTTRVVISLVREGVLQPDGELPAEWRFPANSMRRLRTALRLREGLQLNLAGTALALELLDEVQQLRQRVRLLESMIDDGNAGMAFRVAARRQRR